MGRRMRTPKLILRGWFEGKESFWEVIPGSRHRKVGNLDRKGKGVSDKGKSSSKALMPVSGQSLWGALGDCGRHIAGRSGKLRWGSGAHQGALFLHWWQTFLWDINVPVLLACPKRGQNRFLQPPKSSQQESCTAIGLYRYQRSYKLWEDSVCHRMLITYLSKGGKKKMDILI